MWCAFILFLYSDVTWKLFPCLRPLRSADRMGMGPPQTGGVRFAFRHNTQNKSVTFMWRHYRLADEVNTTIRVPVSLFTKKLSFWISLRIYLSVFTPELSKTVCICFYLTLCLPYPSSQACIQCFCLFIISFRFHFVSFKSFFSQTLEPNNMNNNITLTGGRCSWTLKVLVPIHNCF